ncbi:MAG: hypothetical protein AVDCRST_MAG77-4837, partial [uncultured Chloroflexi bacterium]
VRFHRHVPCGHEPLDDRDHGDHVKAGRRAARHGGELVQLGVDRPGHCPLLRRSWDAHLSDGARLWDLRRQYPLQPPGRHLLDLRGPQGRSGGRPLWWHRDVHRHYRRAHPPALHRLDGLPCDRRAPRRQDSLDLYRRSPGRRLRRRRVDRAAGVLQPQGPPPGGPEGL